MSKQTREERESDAPPPKRRRKAPAGTGTTKQIRKAGWTESKGKRVWRGELWRARVMIDGQLLEAYGTKESEALKNLAEKKKDLASGVAPGQKDTVASYFTRWLDVKKRTVRTRTHERYRQLVNTHLVPAFGKQRLSTVKPDAVQRLYADKIAGGLAPRTVHHIHTVLHNALEQAVKWGYVARNVADVVTPPSVPHHELRPLSGDDVARLLSRAERHRDRLRALWALAAYTGCRQGELLALTWDDLDLSAGEIRIGRVLVRVSNSTSTFGEPKTRRSRRVVPLTNDAIEAPRAQH